jgi:predicted  nucleic acid-binding Zn-ribbon protein
MKRSTLVTWLSIVLFALFLAPDSYGQSRTTAPQRSSPDQVIHELLSEVHQLRVAMQHISVNAYRGQIMVERLRLQQDQVSRLGRDLNDLRSAITEMKAQEPALKERLDDAENQFEKGVLSEVRLKELRAYSVDTKRRQQNMSEREAQLSIELEQERNILNDLNKRLDALEREIVITGLADDGKRKPNQ